MLFFGREKSVSRLHAALHHRDASTLRDDRALRLLLLLLLRGPLLNHDGLLLLLWLRLLLLLRWRDDRRAWLLLLWLLLLRLLLRLRLSGQLNDRRHGCERVSGVSQLSARHTAQVTP